MLCKHCNMKLGSIAGLGDSRSAVCCFNPKCPGKWLEQKCPKCQSNEFNVIISGAGGGIFKCKCCENEWEGLKAI